MAKQHRDIAQEITDGIIAALENGTSPWQKPWKELGGFGTSMPHNASNGKCYRGGNVFWLMIAQQALGFVSAGWMTFKQAKALGGQVRKGEKGTGVVFWKFIEKKDKVTKKEVRIPFMRHYTVFNVEQIDGLPEKITNPEGREPVEVPDLAEWVNDSLQLEGGIQHAGDKAFYAPGPDTIRLPEPSQFSSEDAYNGTLLHEATHATGRKTRLDRLKDAVFGSPEYAEEELVAELGASMLCATLGLNYEVEHHASYIASWLKALKGDKKFIFKAASAAQKAVDYITDADATQEAPELAQVA